MSVYYEPGAEGLADSTHHLQAALEAVAETARKLKEERDEARRALVVVENERDRAKSNLREQGKGMKRLYEMNTHLLAEIVLARQERDEARRALEGAK